MGMNANHHAWVIFNRPLLISWLLEQTHAMLVQRSSQEYISLNLRKVYSQSIYLTCSTLKTHGIWRPYPFTRRSFIGDIARNFSQWIQFSLRRPPILQGSMTNPAPPSPDTHRSDSDPTLRMCPHALLFCDRMQGLLEPLYNGTFGVKNIVGTF